MSSIDGRSLQCNPYAAEQKHLQFSARPQADFEAVQCCAYFVTARASAEARPASPLPSPSLRPALNKASGRER